MEEKSSYVDTLRQNNQNRKPEPTDLKKENQTKLKIDKILDEFYISIPEEVEPNSNRMNTQNIIYLKYLLF